ncbi:patatin-like phospholipase family protein [Hyphomicrobium denitrificans 1NES1]|uniref:Patatin-like phospholipase family protein n=1 Tax=Hyphomicrobium denitrificans 1NES1 TaxID=670307 RepID=N0B8N5_9HYPH|nr:patatin-like phospholipase family protein [Hyphomicrobium denitrificans]AGK56906.1 patatin-like phospholipase family protein [Hyphomicrobium denitrificans 1NES1]
MRLRSYLAAVAVGLVIVGAARAYFGPVHTGVPVGRCLRGDIDLDDPKPFVKTDLPATIVAIAASGGGSRAAYLSAAVLREIRRAGPDLLLGPADGKARSLLDQVAAISSVSGGSLAAAYFTLNSEKLKAADAGARDWTTYLDDMAIEYRKRQWYGAAGLNPLAWARSLTTDYNRGVLARDDYDATLFSGATLTQLPASPALYINAFDVANHVRFVLSRSYIDTTFFQPTGWWGKLAAPQTLASENDLAFNRIDPSSVRLADAVYASSAFPMAYPNLPLKHCGSKILFQGSQIFLADGALADNSGLVTLLTELRADLDPDAKRSTVTIIAIDASVDRIDANGTKFQQTGIEDRYAWEGTVFHHAAESIFGAVALLQDLGWKFIESSDTVTDQLSLNWSQELTHRTGACEPSSKTSWKNSFESGALAMRPLIIRLGLRDVVNPDFASTYSDRLQNRPELTALLAENGIDDGTSSLSRHLSKRLQNIPTDFMLTAADRKLLDLTAFLLVHGKLAGDVAQWNTVRDIAIKTPMPTTTCNTSPRSH